MSKIQPIVKLPEMAPSDLFKGDTIEQILTAIEEYCDSLVFDITTNKGLAECVSAAARVRSSKTLLDKTGKDYKAEITKEAKVIDEKRRMIRERLDPLAVRIRKPATDAEEAEAERVRKLDEKLSSVYALSTIEQVQFAPRDDLKIFEDRLLQLHQMKEELTEENWQEKLEEAKEAIHQGYEGLELAIITRKEHLDQAEELARMKAEEAERKRVAAELEAKKQQELRESQIAEQAARKERERIAKEQAEKEAAANAPTPEPTPEPAKEEQPPTPSPTPVKDACIKQERNREALSAMLELCNISDTAARQVIRAIARGRVPHITINYE